MPSALVVLSVSPGTAPNAGKSLEEIVPATYCVPFPFRKELVGAAAPATR